MKSLLLDCDMKPQSILLFGERVPPSTIWARILKLFRKKTYIKLTPPTPFDPPAAELYIANMGGNSILGFERFASGTAAQVPGSLHQADPEAVPLRDSCPALVRSDCSTRRAR